MKILFIAITLVSLSFSAYADKTYTPKQLNSMVNSGNYPQQTPVKETKTESLSFSDCKKLANNFTSQISDVYPVKIAVSTGITYMLKAWTNDGPVTITCSKPDQQMTLTRASYK